MSRPTKYDPSKNGEVIELMKEGASMIEVAGLLDVDRTTLYRWIDENSDQFNLEFYDTIKKGLALSQIWWEKQARTNLENKDFNSTLWFMNVKNRFRDDWKDKHEHDHTTKGEKINMINLGQGIDPN